jgi:hypothetical protein
MVGWKLLRGDINNPGGTVKAFFQGFLIFMITISVFAGDGQIDIRPTGAATFTISNPGSYVLTDNVTMTADAHCIHITTNDVTLDLNGHTIKGNGSNYTGIYGSATSDITIFNGTVRDFGVKGIELGVNCRLRDITVYSNDGNGVEVDDACQLTRVTAINNGGYGIKALVGCVIKDNACYQNTATGSTGVKAYGIRAMGNSNILAGNTCIDNDGTANSYGIFISGDKNRVENNLCTDNNSGTGTGIFLSSTSDDCVVIRNTTCSNDTGIDLGSKVAYCAENMTTDGIANTGSATLGTGDRANVAY